MNMKLDQLMFAVKNLEDTTRIFEKVLGFNIFTRGIWSKGIIKVPGARMLRMLTSKSGLRIELAQLDEKVKDRFTRFLSKHGEGLFGLCFFSDDYDGDMQSLKNNGIAFEEEKIDKLFPDYPFRVAWVSPEQTHQGIWIEIVDAKALPPFEKEE